MEIGSVTDENYAKVYDVLGQQTRTFNIISLNHGITGYYTMMQASFEGKSVWKAGALSLLSSAASYGIGEAFKNVASNFGNELLRAGAHGLTSGVVSALDGGNFASAFVSGAAASGMGSYAQSVHMNSGLMLASTTAMGGVVAWAIGSDFLQGAIQGMTIGALNHKEHDPVNRGQLFHGKNAHKRAYEYMRKRTLLGKHEVAAVYLENGDVLVFKEKGNTATESNNYFVYKGNNEPLVSVNGKLIRATGQVDTHPYVDGLRNADNPLNVSGVRADCPVAAHFDGTIDILVPAELNGIEAGVYIGWTTSGNGLAWCIPQRFIHFEEYETVFIFMLIYSSTYSFFM